MHDPPMSTSSNLVAHPRRGRTALRLAVVGALVVAIGTAASSISMAGLSPDLVGVIGLLGFFGVGAIILDRRPGEPVGRICLAIGLMYGIAAILRGIATFVDDMAVPLPPAFAAIAVISGAIASLALLLSGPLLISRFPRRAPEAWQRRVEDLLMSMVAFFVVVDALKPGIIETGSITNVPNPLAIDWIPIDSGAIFPLTLLVYGLSYLVTAIGLVDRYRRGGSIVRAQIRWFAAAIAASLLLFLATVLSSGNETINGVAWSIWILSLFLPPLAIAVAIQRYHLYDIDRIISNAIGYGVVTIVLFTIFAAVNLVLVSQMSPLVNDEGVAVAASTLLVAALFNPLRTRVQGAADRHFHRARYDASRMVADFSGRLRDGVEIDRLRVDILDTVDRSVGPSSAVLWLRIGRDQR